MSKEVISVEVKFEDVWNFLNKDDKKEIIVSIMQLLDDDDLIAELEHRGYVVRKYGKE